jgi:hypothetical protein
VLGSSGCLVSYIRLSYIRFSKAGLRASSTMLLDCVWFCVDLMAAGVRVSDDEFTPALLDGLPTAYSMVVTSIESSEDELTLDELVTKLLNTEACVAREEEAEAHLVAPSSWQPRTETQTRHFCGRPSHLQRDRRARIRAEQEASQAKALMAALESERSDRGGEYLNKAFAAFAARKGIIIGMTADCLRESNVAAEQLSRSNALTCRCYVD